MRDFHQGRIDKHSTARGSVVEWSRYSSGADPQLGLYTKSISIQILLNSRNDGKCLNIAGPPHYV